MDPNRKLWNEQHKRLRQALSQPSEHTTAVDLFLCQHAMVHDAEMSNSGLYSFADEVWQGMDETTCAAYRRSSSTLSPGRSGISPALKI
jgi:hypothetical protein